MSEKCSKNVLITINLKTYEWNLEVYNKISYLYHLNNPKTYCNLSAAQRITMQLVYYKFPSSLQHCTQIYRQI